MTDQMTLHDIPLTAEQEIELLLRGGYSQPEIAAKGHDASLVAQVASRMPASLDIDRIPY